MLTIEAGDVLGPARKLMAERKFDEAITELQGVYKSKPMPEIKKAMSEVWFLKGESLMYEKTLAPDVRYPLALHAYRESLRLNPANWRAKDNVAIIELVYKAVGRAVPN